VASAEMALVEICIQMGRIRQPLTGPQGVQVFNDLISGTPLEESLLDYQQLRCPESTALGSCGTNWWKGFKKRHADKIVTKKGERFASCRADWTKKSNIAQMYDVIYDVMVEACISSKQPVPVYTNREGKEVGGVRDLGLNKTSKLIIRTI